MFETQKPYVPEPVTEEDLRVATIAFGWCLGFICWVAASAWRQTHKVSIYTVLVWGEITVCLSFTILCFLYMIGEIPHSFIFYFAILTCWALQVQFLLQIIVNRLNLLISDTRHQNYLKYGVAGLITAINISVYCIWIPARLQINETYMHINTIWDRCEKCIYLVIDALLNYHFIRVVKARLVSNGLDRYRPLVTFNQRLILVSISMDALIIGMMSLPNTFVYMSMHPVAYLVKLLIELSLGSLIVEISSSKPQRGTITGGFEGLKIAVSTHTTTTAFRVDDEEEGDGAPPIRTTRTPARPDLQVRLEKMRRERKERKEALARGEDPDDVRIEMSDREPQRRGSDYSIDVEEKMELDDWQAGVRHLSSAPQGSGRDDGGGRGVRFVVSNDSQEKL
ncbi:hypothetical protein JCM10450v2_004828 [Rhodotorula kratochvilovae]